MEDFKSIIQTAIEDAENVDCTSEEFNKGLVVMFQELRQRLEAEDIDLDDLENV